MEKSAIKRWVVVVLSSNFGKTKINFVNQSVGHCTLFENISNNIDFSLLWQIVQLSLNCTFFEILASTMDFPALPSGSTSSKIWWWWYGRWGRQVEWIFCKKENIQTLSIDRAKIRQKKKIVLYFDLALHTQKNVVSMWNWVMEHLIYWKSSFYNIFRYLF